MIVDLGDPVERKRPFDFTVAPEDLDLGVPGVRLTGNIEVRGELTKQLAQTDVTGSIKGAAEIDCTRCLKPVPTPISIDFDVVYVDPEHFASESETEVAADDLKADVLPGDQLDLKEVVREQILLELPEQIYCAEDCKGLCAKCGADLNLIDCKCDDTEIDPRWAALKDLQ